ncbi:MAG TPA: prolyl oligopeptidase family serine peptidase [Steroidobacteraceae bacterium]|nr:prolyl oligopeptidase family serine peptidase [Steroidobacteraceae bacterium]
MLRIAVLAACGALSVSVSTVMAQSLPLATFSASPRISDASISPDGRYLAILTTIKKAQTLVVQDRTASGPGALHAVISAGDGFELMWCRWASETRILCGLHAPSESRGVVVSKTRLVGADADGKNVKVLVEVEDSPGTTFLGRILAWDIPGRPNAVLMLARRGPMETGFGGRVMRGGIETLPPSVFAFDAVTGDLKMETQPHEPLTSYLVDTHGEAVLGWGPAAPGTTEYDVRDPQSHAWRKLATLPGNLQPVALCPAPSNCAYALGDSDGHMALWRIDLAGKEQPVVEFAHPSADLDTPLLARDGHLFGVRYDTTEPMVYYVDTAGAAIVDKLKRLLPGQFIEPESYTRDGHRLIVKASSDTDPGTFYLYDADKNVLARVGSGYPDLVADRIGHPRAVSFSAKDGTMVPGYLTLPPGAATKNLPLIALPHGATAGHDTNTFNLLRAFLVNRGYAVLQVNYRGSSGLGSKWLGDAHGDWNGLPYSDVADGVRWAIAQGIADAHRIAIIGSDQGGYLALLGAERNPDLFRCAVSIGGYSEGGSAMLVRVKRGTEYTTEPIMPPTMGGFGGPPPDVLEKQRADSPRAHAADFKAPVLLVHGEWDTEVSVEQSKAMDAALTSAHKPHQLLLLPGADHAISMEDDRAKMFTALETFLTANLH